MVLSGLCVGIFSSLVDQKSHIFSRAITLAIPEKHAWARAVGKLLT